MLSVTSAADTFHLGMDVSKKAIVVAVLAPGQELPVLDRIWNDEGAVRRLVSRLAGQGRVLRACYEAGPTGFGLCRLLVSLGVDCEVVAPSLIPRGRGDRVKTDRRDAVRLARLHRAGELTPVRVPSPAEEAVRDLVRARAALLEDRKRAQQRVTALLLRHDRIWRGTYWTAEHERWVAGQGFGEPALDAALTHYRAALQARAGELAAVEMQLAAWAAREPLAPAVARLGCYRGIGELTAIILAAEVIDWRRFASARAFMSFTGLVPAEHSSGDTTRRGPITKAGSQPVRTALTEAAWAYQHKPAVGTALRRRQARAAASPATLARSWQAQRRLHARYLAMTSRRKPGGVVATAIARELAGFVWAEMTS